MKILFFLQNAYYNDGFGRDEQQWQKDLWRSLTGKRLKQMIPDGADIRLANASPVVGNVASACYPPDLQHMRKAIRKHRPDVICACGKIAQRGLDEIGVEYVAAPHPAWRALTKEHIARIRQQLQEKT